ncbi:succinate dehydrogenase assembly factor 2 [Hartmannibacter diazotrophicus]
MLYHSWHRGTREMDLLLGRFVDANIADLADEELDELDTLMEVEDKTLFAWIIGQDPVPSEKAGPVFERIVRFHRDNPIAAD